MEVNYATRASSPPPVTQQAQLTFWPVRLDQLWQHLPADRQETIGATLAQMIAKQIVAKMPSPPPVKEESDE